MIDQWLAFASEFQPIFLILGLFSLAGFFCSLFIVPLLITRLPADYFITDRGQRTQSTIVHAAFRLPLLLVKNLIALLLFLMGVLMLVIPGQGILTILLAVCLVDFPRKLEFQRWLIRQPSILSAVNWLRSKYNKEPFEF